MQKIFSFLLLLGFIVAPNIGMADTGQVSSTVQRTVVPAPVVKNYQPEQATQNITVLKLGVKGQPVTLLQGLLANFGYYNSTIDGHFGKKTEEAVKAFQRDSFGELSVDGVAGPQTLKYIERMPVVANRQVATNQNNTTNNTTNNQTKVTIPSLPRNVLTKALTAPPLVSADQVTKPDGTRLATAKPKLVTPSGYRNAGVFVIPNNLNTNNSSVSVPSITTNYATGEGVANARYVCGEKDGVRHCFVVSLAEAEQIDAGVLDVDAVLLARSGGSGQNGNCPAFFIDQNGNAGVTDQSWWSDAQCANQGQGSGATLANAPAGKVCFEGMLYDESTGITTNEPCTGGQSPHIHRERLDPGEAACLSGVRFNPVTGARCGALPKNLTRHVDSAPLICRTGANFDPMTGARCVTNARVPFGAFENTLAAYAIESLDKVNSVNKGEKSKAADIVQRVLANYGFLKPEYQTGYSGDLTENAVKSFQRRLGLNEDGKIAGDTLAYIKAAIASDDNLKNVKKAQTTVDPAQSASKVLNLLNKFPSGLPTTTNITLSAGSGSSGGTTTTTFGLNTQFALNPTNSTATETAADIGKLTCMKKWVTEVGMNGGKEDAPMLTTRIILGTDKYFYLPANSNFEIYNYGSGDAAGAAHPRLKVVAGIGTNGIMLSYSSRPGVDGLKKSDFSFTENPLLQYQGQIFTISQDATKYYSFDLSGLNSTLPDCQVPAGGNGFQGLGRKVNAPLAGGSTGGTSGTGGTGGTSGTGGTTGTGGTGTGGGTIPGSCWDGIQNQGETGIDTGGPCGTGSTGGTVTSGGANPHVDNDGNPCPTPGVPCHNWHGHKWAGSYPLQFTLRDYLTTPKFKTSLAQAVDDWNLSPRLNLQIAQGVGQPMRDQGLCISHNNQIPICEGYFNEGFLGVASLATTGGQIIGYGVTINTKFMNGSQNYSSQAYSDMVMCQEIGHGFSVMHFTENFDDPDTFSCMNYTNQQIGANNDRHPNVVDMNLLEQVIYPLNSGQSGSSSSSSSANINANIENAIKNLSIKSRKDMGRPIEAQKGIITHYQKDIQVGGQTISIYNHLFPVPPAN